MFLESELAELENRAVQELNALPAGALDTPLVSRGKRKQPNTGALGQLPAAGGALKAFKGGDRSRALGWARDFTIEFLSEIREVICKQHGTSARQRARSAGTVSAGSAASALAAWLSQTFATASPVAIGIATLILLVIGRAIKSAFCAVTQAKISQELAAANF